MEGCLAGWRAIHRGTEWVCTGVGWGWGCDTVVLEAYLEEQKQESKWTSRERELE